MDSLRRRRVTGFSGPAAFAIKDTRIVTVSGEAIEHGTVDGLIEGVGAEPRYSAGRLVIEGRAHRLSKRGGGYGSRSLKVGTQCPEHYGDPRTGARSPAQRGQPLATGCSQLPPSCPKAV